MGTTLGLRARVGPKGQAVIPKPIRDELGIRPGDDVIYRLHDGHAHVEKDDPKAALEAFFASIPTVGKGEGLKPGEFRRLRDEAYGDG